MSDVTARDLSHHGIRYAVPRWSPAWAIPEVPVPESQLHDEAIEYVRALLLAWAARTQRSVAILRNIGIRWVPSEPRAGFDPDLCLLQPAPHAPGGLSSLRLWEPNVSAPAIALEIVSPGHPYKDYVDTPERAAACGVQELWVFDPLLAGPRQHGGPFLLQLWRREGATLERVHAGEGPVYSEPLSAWLHPCASRIPTQARLRISDERGGEPRWPTAVEQERQAAQAAEAQAQAAQAQAQAAQAQAAQAQARAQAAEQRARAAEQQLAELRARRGRTD